MPDILPLLLKLSPALPKTTCRQLHRIVVAMLAMTGRITQLGISRWTDKGGSYRTIQRFFHTKINWEKVQWLFFQNFLYRPGSVYLLAGDESVLSKSGKKSHGIGWFFSSILNTAIPGLAFFSIAIIEFTFRDAKQYFGLEDFMGVQEISIHNAAGLSFFMVNLSRHLLDALRTSYPGAGVNDLKSFFRARHYIAEVLKFVPENAGDISYSDLIEQVCRHALIHPKQKSEADLQLAA